MSVLATELSLDQFYAMEETKPATELVDGEPIQKAMPTYQHSELQPWLCYLLLNTLGKDRGRVCSELNLELYGRVVLVPDVCVLRDADRRPVRAITEPPLLCVEIISPSDRFSKTNRKCQRYLEWGVPVCWIINPEKRKAWIVDASGTTEVLTGGVLLADDIAIPLSEVFPG